MALIHHELCFGCGRTNLFGLLAELHETEPGRVEGRCFIKQDHQGPDPGSAHPGVVATALMEAMAFAGAAGEHGIELQVTGRTPVGEFLELEARRESGEAIARVHGRVIATARVVYAPPG